MAFKIGNQSKRSPSREEQRGERVSKGLRSLIGPTLQMEITGTPLYNPLYLGIVLFEA